MYCSHCGTENENTAKFCRQCGNALQANAQSNSAPSAFEQEISASKGRQSVANFLRAFQAHVAPQAKNYSVLNAQCSQMEMLERQRADFEKRVKSPVLLILGIVLIALGIGLIASFVSYMQAHIDEAVIIENPTLADYLDTFVALLFLAGPLIIGGIIIAIFIVRKARAPKTRTKFDSQYAHPSNPIFRKRELPARNEGHREREPLRNARNARADKVHSTPTCVYRRHVHYWCNRRMAQLAIAKAHISRARLTTSS